MMVWASVTGSHDARALMVGTCSGLHAIREMRECDLWSGFGFLSDKYNSSSLGGFLSNTGKQDGWTLTVARVPVVVDDNKQLHCVSY